MIHKVKLTENYISRLVKESIYTLITEEKLTNYEQILQNEFIRAQKDVQNSRATFHNGIRDSLLSKGYIIET